MNIRNSKSENFIQRKDYLMENREKDLELFFHKDMIDLKDYPIKPIQEKIVLHKTVYDFTSLKEPVKSELKLFLQYALRKPLGKASLCGDYLGRFII